MSSKFKITTWEGYATMQVRTSAGSLFLDDEDTRKLKEHFLENTGVREALWAQGFQDGQASAICDLNVHDAEVTRKAVVGELVEVLDISKGVWNLPDLQDRIRSKIAYLRSQSREPEVISITTDGDTITMKKQGDKR